MRNRYWTNFVINEKTNAIVLMMDFERSADSLRDALSYHDIKGIKVERVGPLSDAPLFETPGEWEPWHAEGFGNHGRLAY